MFKAGNCFIGKYPPGTNKQRRFVILTDEIDGECTVVWTYTSTIMLDLSCVFTPQDHPMFTEDCAVVYEAATAADANMIRIAVSGGGLVPQAQMAPPVLKRAFDALFASDLTPEGILDYCADL